VDRRKFALAVVAASVVVLEILATELEIVGLGAS
jgi:hypothetical protein